MGQLNRHLKPINAELKRKLWPEKLESENKMNERIQELAEQAGMIVDKYGLARDAENGLEDGVDIYKFAELIVQECLFIIDDERKPNMVDRVELWKQIKEHFGVES